MASSGGDPLTHGFAGTSDYACIPKMVPSGGESAAHGIAGTSASPPGPEQLMHFLTFWRHLVDLGFHFGGHRILKGSPDRQFSFKNNIKSENKVCKKVS